MTSDGVQKSRYYCRYIVGIGAVVCGFEDGSKWARVSDSFFSGCGGSGELVSLLRRRPPGFGEGGGRSAVIGRGRGWEVCGHWAGEGVGGLRSLGGEGGGRCAVIGRGRGWEVCGHWEIGRAHV